MGLAEYEAIIYVDVKPSGERTESYLLGTPKFFRPQWSADTFEDLLAKYRGSDKGIRRGDAFHTIKSERFYVGRDGTNTWQKPFSPEQMEKLSQEVVAKLGGK